MSITAKMVSDLRDRTGAGMMAVKKALEEAQGDEQKAIEILQKTGAAKAAKRSGRATGQGMVFSYIHTTGKLGVLLELQCETDFVARNEDFQELGRQLCMHVAASDPQYADVESVPAQTLETKKAAFAEEAAGKPSDVVDKIVAGKLDKWYAEDVLVRQPFVMDEDKTIGQVITEAIARIGENIRVARFARFNMEGGMSACEASAPLVETEA